MSDAPDEQAVYHYPPPLTRLQVWRQTLREITCRHVWETSHVMVFGTDEIHQSDFCVKCGSPVPAQLHLPHWIHKRICRHKWVGFDAPSLKGLEVCSCCGRSRKD